MGKIHRSVSNGQDSLIGQIGGQMRSDKGNIKAANKKACIEQKIARMVTGERQDLCERLCERLLCSPLLPSIFPPPDVI